MTMIMSSAAMAIRPLNRTLLHQLPSASLPGSVPAPAAAAAPHGLTSSSCYSSSSPIFGARPCVTAVKASRPQIVVDRRKDSLIRASAAQASEPAAADPPPSPTGEAAANPLAALKMQSEILKKAAKKLELRRKRLVRKRRLRKKGRWPPSKVAKNKNI